MTKKKKKTNDSGELEHGDAPDRGSGQGGGGRVEAGEARLPQAVIVNPKARQGKHKEKRMQRK
jgi:hypothetical protein